MIFKSDGGKGDLNGFLDAGSHMDGELRFEDTFRIDGRLTGKVRSSGDLVVGERGEVDGDLEVGRIYISGSVQGSIKASRRVELTAGSRLRADIETPALVIEEGAFFEGSCSMVRPGEPRTADKERPAGKERPAVVRKMPVSKDG